MSLQSISSQFEQEYTRISAKALAEIERDIYSIEPKEIADYIRKIFRKYKINEKTQKLMMEYIVKGAAFGIGAKTLADPIAFRKVWLNKVHDMEGVKLSSRIHDMTRHDELIYELKNAMTAKESWGMAAQAVFKKGIQRGDVAKDIDNLLSQARKVYRIADDSEAYAAYKSEVKAVQRRIDRLINPDTSKLKHAYQQVVDITNKSSKSAVEQAAHYANYFKEKYNTERLVNTEISRAYGQARIVEMQDNDDVIGVRIVLNSAHGEEDRDICDFFAEADLYGLGPGGYPKDHMPTYPLHPWCLCKMVDIYMGEYSKATEDDFDPKQGQKYLESLPKKERVSLLGRGGAEAFGENPKSWRKHLKNYHDPVKIKAKIPKEILYNE